MSVYGIYKTAALSPRVTVACPEKNADTALEMLHQAAEKGVGLAVLPELHLSAYTCADLFHQDALIHSCEKALARMLADTEKMSMVWVCGLPVRVGCALYASMGRSSVRFRKHICPTIRNTMKSGGLRPAAACRRG